MKGPVKIFSKAFRLSNSIGMKFFFLLVVLLLFSFGIVTYILNGNLGKQYP